MQCGERNAVNAVKVHHLLTASQICSMPVMLTHPPTHPPTHRCRRDHHPALCVQPSDRGMWCLHRLLGAALRAEVMTYGHIGFDPAPCCLM